MESIAINASGSEPERFLNTKEAAKFLSLSPRTLEGYRQQGIGPEYRKHGRTVVYALSCLIEWSARRKYFSTSEYPKKPKDNNGKAGKK